MIGWDVLDKENQDFRKDIDGYHKSDLALMTVEQSVIDRRYQGGDVQKEKDESAFEQVGHYDDTLGAVQHFFGNAFVGRRHDGLQNVDRFLHAVNGVFPV